MFEELINVLERLDAWGNPSIKIERNGSREGERYWLVRVHSRRSTSNVSRFSKRPTSTSPGAPAKGPFGI